MSETTASLLKRSSQKVSSEGEGEAWEGGREMRGREGGEDETLNLSTSHTHRWVCDGVSSADITRPALCAEESGRQQ